MDDRDWLAERFQEHRPRLRAVAYRMLGSPSEADDAVQEAWIRLGRTDAGQIENLEAWLVTVVGRVALTRLRSRRTRREEPLEDRRADPSSAPALGLDPEHEALLADSVGLALLVVLETLRPAERLAYVLHDMFSVPFDEIGVILDRSPEAARQLASRARRRLRDADRTAGATDADMAAQREVVDAFLAAARHGDFDALVAVLDSDVVVRDDDGSGEILVVQGAENVARRATAFAQLGVVGRPAVLDGALGWISQLDGEVFAVAAVTVRNRRIARMDIRRTSRRSSAGDPDPTGRGSGGTDAPHPPR